MIISRKIKLTFVFHNTIAYSCKYLNTIFTYYSDHGFLCMERKAIKHLRDYDCRDSTKKSASVEFWENTDFPRIVLQAKYLQLLK